jgi:hypothetical protein
MNDLLPQRRLERSGDLDPDAAGILFRRNAPRSVSRFSTVSPSMSSMANQRRPSFSPAWRIVTMRGSVSRASAWISIWNFWRKPFWSSGSTEGLELRTFTATQRPTDRCQAR